MAHVAITASFMRLIIVVACFKTYLRDWKENLRTHPLNGFLVLTLGAYLGY